MLFFFFVFPFNFFFFLNAFPGTCRLWWALDRKEGQNLWTKQVVTGMTSHHSSRQSPDMQLNQSMSFSFRADWLEWYCHLTSESLFTLEQCQLSLGLFIWVINKSSEPFTFHTRLWEKGVSGCSLVVRKEKLPRTQSPSCVQQAQKALQSLAHIEIH